MSKYIPPKILPFIHKVKGLQRVAEVRWRGLCPFHIERTPSFYVSEHNGFWHCFGCGKGGNEQMFKKELKNATN